MEDDEAPPGPAGTSEKCASLALSQGGSPLECTFPITIVSPDIPVTALGPGAAAGSGVGWMADKVRR